MPSLSVNCLAVSHDKSKCLRESCRLEHTIQFIAIAILLGTHINRLLINFKFLHKHLRVCVCEITKKKQKCNSKRTTAQLS